MKKRHIQNCLSKEELASETDVKKYKIEIERVSEDYTICDSETSNILESVTVISDVCSSEPEASTSASGLASVSDPKSLPFVESNSNSEGNINSKTKCEQIVSWAVRNKISQNALADLLNTLKSIDVKDVNEDLPQSSGSSTSKNNAKSEDVYGMLKYIAQRLEKLEQNQASIMQNQSILGNGQNSIVATQQQIATKLDKIEESIVSKPEIMAQTDLLMECKVAIKNVEHSVCLMTGETENKNLDEVTKMLPFQTIAAVQAGEEKMGTPEFAQAITTYLHKYKGISGDVSSVIRALFTDDLLQSYNWEGRWGKHALRTLMVINKPLREVFQLQGTVEFEKNVKKAVERSHNRLKQKIYLYKNCK